MRDVCISLFQKEQKEKAYKIYVTECLRMIAQNTAASVNGVYTEMSFYELTEGKRKPQVEAGVAAQKIRGKLRG